MILYGNESEYKIEGLEEVELQHLGSQLVNYVTTYRKLIHIVDEDVERKLDILYDIGMKIVTRQYHLLFNDPSVVIPNFKQTTLKEFQDELFQSMPL